MSLWEYSSVVDGYNAAHGGDEGNKASSQELQTLSDILDSVPLTKVG